MPTQRKALGRGLSVLLGTPDFEPDQLREIDIDRVAPNAHQPRKSFDINSLDDLAESIRVHGVVQPIVVRTTPGGDYEIIAGERRWRAAQKVGLARVPALVRESKEHHALELALVENVQRENLNPMDQAQAYQRLLSEFGLTQEEVAQRVGKSRASVANMLRLLKLPEEVQQWLREGQLTVGHAKALLSLPDSEEAILKVAEEMIRGAYSVRQAELLVHKASKRKREQEPEAKEREDPNVQAALRALERALGTKVAILERNGQGRIEIHFHSKAELERLYNGLLATRF